MSEPEEHAKALLDNMEQIRTTLTAAAARLNEGNDHQALVQVMVAAGATHDALLALTKLLGDTIVELLK